MSYNIIDSKVELFFETKIHVAILFTCLGIPESIRYPVDGALNSTGLALSPPIRITVAMGNRDAVVVLVRDHVLGGGEIFVANVVAGGRGVSGAGLGVELAVGVAEIAGRVFGELIPFEVVDGLLFEKMFELGSDETFTKFEEDLGFVGKGCGAEHLLLVFFPEYFFSIYQILSITKNTLVEETKINFKNLN